ncbi:MAG TPA: helix-turn-helix domain-containing protein [Stellaceae bacterium]|nr:helix-turn-helix domain-containing protein [Stellaceae bacterium]
MKRKPVASSGGAAAVPARWKREVKRKSRVKTELGILKALEGVLTRHGFEGLGVNAVAQAAGVSKELIYRYFGGLEGLILAWVEERDYWSIRRIDGTQHRLEVAGADAKTMMRHSLKTFLRDLRSKPQIQEIRRWEVHSRSPLARRIARRREEAGRRLMSKIPEDPAHDIAAIYGVLQAGLCYLVLRSTVLKSYGGVSLRSAGGWKRFERAVDEILDAVFDQTPRESGAGAKPSRRSNRSA